MAVQLTIPRIAVAGDLVALACALGARDVAGWSLAEERLANDLPAPSAAMLVHTRAAIQAGEDPLGDAFSALFSAEERRPKGATYTPQAIVESMVAWAVTRIDPVRIVDPGAGSARFLVAAGRRFPNAHLVAIEIDPLAALLARAHLAAAGLADRAEVILGDFRRIDLLKVDGPTLFLGNPPYVRHHQIEPEWKEWLRETARRFGLEASQLAGLHVHFYLSTALQGRPGDVGIYITAAEWLDVNYGRLVRELLTGVLHAELIQVIEPSAEPFPGTQATGVITGFSIGQEAALVRVQRVAAVPSRNGDRREWDIPRSELAAATRWTPLMQAQRERRAGYVELGELCRVHRGQVTGANRVWIYDENTAALPPGVLFPAITKARELFATDGVLADDSGLRRVIDLPVDLDVLSPEERRLVERFLDHARSQGAGLGFIARHRKAWWSVGLREPAPILATYMARRPPIFVRNVANARHINIAHGLYPREPLSDLQTRALARFLSTNVSVTDGRTYAGGLTKFEPREMERLLVPGPELLVNPAFTEIQS